MIDFLPECLQRFRTRALRVVHNTCADADPDVSDVKQNVTQCVLVSPTRFLSATLPGPCIMEWLIVTLASFAAGLVDAIVGGGGPVSCCWRV